MIGEHIEFRTEKDNPNSYGGKVNVIINGKVMDKICDLDGYVARGWAMSKGSNNVACQTSKTYYMVADANGAMYLVYPNDIVKILWKQG